MGGPVIIVALIFGTIFGIFYLHYSTRNKERLALIDKGVDASIFVRGKVSTPPIWKILILNLALLLIFIGLGIFIIFFLNFMMNIEPAAIQAVTLGTLFLMAGIGLLIGYRLTKKLGIEDQTK